MIRNDFSIFSAILIAMDKQFFISFFIQQPTVQVIDYMFFNNLHFFIAHKFCTPRCFVSLKPFIIQTIY